MAELPDETHHLHVPDEPPGLPRSPWSRRRILKLLSVAAIAPPAFGRALAALAATSEAPKITKKMIRDAEWVSGITLDDAKRELLLTALPDLTTSLGKLRSVGLDNSVGSPLVFAPAYPVALETIVTTEIVDLTPERARRDDASGVDLAFGRVSELAALLRSREVTSVELTRLYLDRLKFHDPVLKCVITLTEALALEQAEEADREIAAGRWRGPLHGIPWVAKDLIAVPGYHTTWGSAVYRNQTRPETAAVYERLVSAGAVLLAKSSVGELAWGDVWFGGRTETPWRRGVGSSGSSAGSAAATAAGLTGFGIGTETWGSIVSPATRCGITGLRPTFGRVSRFGVMALTWSMDKVGVLARSALDCGLVFQAIQGPDPRDPATVERSFKWPTKSDPRKLRVGYADALFSALRPEQPPSEDGTEVGTTARSFAEWKANDLKSLDDLRAAGFDLRPVDLSTKLPVGSLSVILIAEAATIFDDLTRSGRDAQLVRQVANAWPTVFRQGQLVPAVEYLRANRLRTLLLREVEHVMADLDVLVTPSFVGDTLLMTNLTGHPALCMPNGFRADGLPTSITLIGKLHGEAELLAVGQAYQQATQHHLFRPSGY